MYDAMLSTAVSAGKQASLTIAQFTQKDLVIYGLHNFNLDVRNIFAATIKKGVSQEKHTNIMSLCFDMTEWYSSGRHIATYLSYAMTERMDRSAQINEAIT